MCLGQRKKQDVPLRTYVRVYPVDSNLLIYFFACSIKLHSFLRLQELIFGGYENVSQAMNFNYIMRTQKRELGAL